jgi:hypothetical protein
VDLRNISQSASLQVGQLLPKAIRRGDDECPEPVTSLNGSHKLPKHQAKFLYTYHREQLLTLRRFASAALHFFNLPDEIARKPQSQLQLQQQQASRVRSTSDSSSLRPKPRTEPQVTTSPSPPQPVIHYSRRELIDIRKQQQKQQRQQQPAAINSSQTRCFLPDLSAQSSAPEIFFRSLGR